MDRGKNEQYDNRTTGQSDNGTMDAGAKPQWDTGTMERPRVPGHGSTGQCGNETMGQWDNGTVDDAAMDNGTMDNATMRQWGRGTMVNGTMDACTMDTRTIGPWDIENGTVRPPGQWDSGAVGREGHGRRDNAQ
jgi:hypothetical protein